MFKIQKMALGSLKTFIHFMVTATIPPIFCTVFVNLKLRGSNSFTIHNPGGAACSDVL